MAYNQSFTPQAGQGNLSAQFSTSQPASTGSAPRDITGRRRLSSTSEGLGVYPAQSTSYTGTSPGTYGGYQQQYGASPRMTGPPSHMPPYGSSPSHQRYQPQSQSYNPSHGFSTSPAFQPAQRYRRSSSDAGWQHPSYYDQSTYPSTAYSHADERRRSSASTKESEDSSPSPERKHKPRRRNTEHERYDSPRRPTMTDSVMAAWDGLKGAFDARK